MFPFHLSAIFFSHGKRDLAVYVIHAHFRFFSIWFLLKSRNPKFSANFTRKVINSLVGTSFQIHEWSTFAGSQMCDDKAKHQYLARHLIFLLQPSFSCNFFQVTVFVENIPRNMSYNRNFRPLLEPAMKLQSRWRVSTRILPALRLIIWLRYWNVNLSFLCVLKSSLVYYILITGNWFIPKWSFWRGQNQGDDDSVYPGLWSFQVHWQLFY